MRTVAARPGFYSEAALLWRIAGMLFQYFVAGGRLRRAYRRKEARGEVFWVDGRGPTSHREAPLRKP